MKARCVQTDGAQPVGRGIGPALEAHDILAVLQNRSDAPADLLSRACKLAGAALEMAGAAQDGHGFEMARQVVADGRAWAKFQRICEGQGGMRSPPRAVHTAPLVASRPGRVVHINNRQVATLAKLAGAPERKAAGLFMRTRLGEEVARGEPLLEVHAETPGELAYALDYAAQHPEIIEIRGMSTNDLILALPGSEQQAKALAEQLGARLGTLETRRFPDGESYVRVASDVAGKRVVLVCSLANPDPQFLRLVFTARAARELGSASVVLVATYLAYMRQDKRFHDGEAVTSRHFAQLISAEFDGLVTVDPHLHRHRSLDEIYTIPAVALRSAPLLADWIAANVDRPLIIGPDVESEQWVSEVAARAKAPYLVLSKTRHGDRDVEIPVPELGEWAGRQPVLIDDIVSSGRTMIETAQGLIDRGAKPPVCLAVHALFAEDAYERLTALAARVVSTDAVSHDSNVIELAALLAEGLSRL